MRQIICISGTAPWNYNYTIDDFHRHSVNFETPVLSAGRNARPWILSNKFRTWCSEPTEIGALLFEILSRATNFPHSSTHKSIKSVAHRQVYHTCSWLATWIYVRYVAMPPWYRYICSRYGITLANIYLKPLQPIRPRLPRLLCTKWFLYNSSRERMLTFFKKCSRIRLGFFD